MSVYKQTSGICLEMSNYKFGNLKEICVIYKLGDYPYKCMHRLQSRYKLVRWYIIVILFQK